MGSERASTTFQRESGIICCQCSCRIPVIAGEIRSHGERICKECDRRAAYRAGRHYEVMMNFQHRECWTHHFISADAKTPISRIFSVNTLDELRALVLITNPPPAILDEFEQNLRAWGRGTVTLHVTARQLVSIIRGLKSPATKG